jgi:hypothetical protein
MNKLFFLVACSLLLIVLSSYSQEQELELREKPGSSCDFFDRLQFEGGVDTVTFKGAFKGYFRWYNHDGMPVTEKRAKNRSPQKYNISIAFKKDGCEDIIVAPTEALGADAAALFKENLGKPITITFIFFKQGKYGFEGKYTEQPFVIADKIEIIRN